MYFSSLFTAMHASSTLLTGMRPTAMFNVFIGLVPLPSSSMAKKSSVVMEPSSLALYSDCHVSNI